jgi:hypothetical protein
VTGGAEWAYLFGAKTRTVAHEHNSHERCDLRSRERWIIRDRTGNHDLVGGAAGFVIGPLLETASRFAEFPDCGVRAISPRQRPSLA